MKLWDQSDTYNLIKKYPGQFDRGFRLAEPISIPKNIDQIVITAFSYSASAAEIVKDLFAADLSIPIYVHSGYMPIPKTTSKTLVIALSICGQRPEILWAVHAAHLAGAAVVAVTTGGELEIFARERHLPLVLIDKKSPELQEIKNGGVTMPLGAGLILAILVQILINAEVLSAKEKQHILAATNEIENMYLPKLGSKISDLARNTNLLIYSSERYSGLVNFAKNIINILAAMPNFTNTITGSLGSDIHAFSHHGVGKYFALILQDKSEIEPIQYSINKLKEKIIAAKLKHYILELPGSNQLAKTLAGIMLFYWVVYSLVFQQK